MSNSYYTASGNPGTRASVSSSPIRAEFTNLQTAFDKLPPLTANKAVIVNAGGTALTVSTGNLALGANLTLNGGAVTFSGSFTTTWTATANTTITLPTTDTTLIGADSIATLTHKTFDTAGTGNVFKINGTQISDKIGTGKAVLDTSPTIASPTLTNATITVLTATGVTVETQAGNDRSTKAASTAFVGLISDAKLTAGTGTHYTLTYSPAVAALADGMTHFVRFHAANADAADLNVNSLGAKPLKFFCNSWAAVVANMIATDSVYRVVYDLATDAYWVVGLEYKITKIATGAATIDFTSIPSVIDHLTLDIECTISTNAAAIAIRTYGADGVLDTGGTDYYGVASVSNSASGAPTVNAGSGSALFLGTSMSNGDYGFSCFATADNIQAATRTKFSFSSQYGDSGGTNIVSVAGASDRQEADRITGVRVFVSSGTFTGKVSIKGR